MRLRQRDACSRKGQGMIMNPQSLRATDHPLANLQNLLPDRAAMAAGLA
jgi:hypothetical protein